MPNAFHPSHTPAPLVRAVGLQLRFGQQTVFTGLDFELRPGLTLVCGGESCGKTSLLRLLAGVLAPTAGVIDWLAGSSQATQTALQRCTFWVDVRSTDLDAISADTYWASLPGRYPTFDPQVLAALVHELGLQVHREKPMYMLSTGSKRKVWLAGAFASRAALTLIDEPFAALDQRSVACVSAWLNKVAQDRKRAWVIADYAAPAPLAVQHTLALDAFGPGG